MKSLIALAAALTLTACGTTGNGFVGKEVVVQYQYVTRKATDQQKAIPPYPAEINVQTASQLELANWIAESEQRQWTLESIITELVNFYEKPFTQAEVNTMPVPGAVATPPTPAASTPVPARRIFGR